MLNSFLGTFVPYLNERPVLFMTQAEYLTEIIKLLNQCDDIGLLDIIFRILEKSMPTIPPIPAETN